MRILIASDIGTHGEGNPYALQLLHALGRNPRVEAVQHGTSWLHESGIDFDVIHIQWPEALFAFEEPSPPELDTLEIIFEKWKRRGASLVTTVHNEYPHGRDTEKFQRLYRITYEKSDALIHLGSVSEQVVRKRYASEIRDTREVVIPHGRYSYYSNDVDAIEAREELSLPTDKPIMLAFGEIRSLEEARLLRNGFIEAQENDERLVVACRLPHRSLRDWKHITTRLPFWINSQIHLWESYIPADRVQIYLNAADVLVLPRINALNSGNVALGWTFGTVVVGPSTGVIGEMLRDQNCPTFESPTPRSLAKAITKGLKQAYEGKGKELKCHANQHLNWDRLADSHIDIYYEVSKSYY